LKNNGVYLTVYLSNETIYLTILMIYFRFV
jgi:hypothetical protein